MANVLSQDEVDSLLEGISDGGVETETDIPEKCEDVEVYDFSIPAGDIHLRMPGLKIINERLVGFLKKSLSTASRLVTGVSLLSIESVKFSEFSRSLPLPASLNIFKMEPLRGFFLLVLESPLVFSFVDSFFGGRGLRHVKLEGRSFTAIETKIIGKIVEIILGCLKRAWLDVCEVKTVYTRSEIDPQFAAIVTPEDAVIVIKFTVHLENGSGMITICMPYSNIEPIKNKLKYESRSEKMEVDQTWRRYIEKKIMEMTMEISCKIGMAKINGRELLEMKVDDVIMLDQKIGDSLIINVEGIPKFKGYPGSYSNMKAIKISERLN